LAPNKVLPLFLMSNNDVSMLEIENSITGMSMQGDGAKPIDVELLLDTLEESVGSGITTKTHRSRLALKSNSGKHAGKNGSGSGSGSGSGTGKGSFGLNASEHDVLDFFDELFSSSGDDSGKFSLVGSNDGGSGGSGSGGGGGGGGGGGCFCGPESGESSLDADVSSGSSSFANFSKKINSLKKMAAPSPPMFKHVGLLPTYSPQLPQHKPKLEAKIIKKKKRPSLSSKNLPQQTLAARAPPRATAVSLAPGTLVGADVADKVFAQEMPLSASENLSIKGIKATFLTTFFDRYWRNKRYNVQCFPRDGDYGDYCNWLMAPKNEQRDLSSSLPVRIQFLNETGQEYDQIHCLGRIIPLTDRKKVCVPGSYLPFNLTDLSSMGADNSFCVGVRTNQEPNLFTIAPKIWKCAYQLPRKRRQGVDYRMCLEVMIVGSKKETGSSSSSSSSSSSPSSSSLMCMAWLTSPAFELGSTRTLMRLKVQYKESLRGGSVSARNLPTKRTKSEEVIPDEREDEKRQKQGGSMKFLSQVPSDDIVL